MRKLAIVIIVLILLAADVASGMSAMIAPGIISCNNPPNLMQCASDSCTVAIGAFFCRKTETFSPAFPAIPKVYANFANCAGGTFCQHTPTFGGFRSVVFVDENTTWLNMPVAVTPFDSDTSGTFAQFVDFSKIGAYRLVVTCPVASTSVASPFLSVQWSNDLGATWRYLATAQTPTSKVIIDGFGNFNGAGGQCGLGGYNNLVGDNAVSLGFVGIDPNLNYLTTNLDHILVRIVGANGGGLGDAPVFSRITVEFQITGTINDNRDVLSSGFFCNGLSSGATVSNVIIECDVIGAVTPGTATISFTWTAIAS